jgi:fatty acid desaturase
VAYDAGEVCSVEAFAFTVLGLVVRQVDRWWFSDLRKGGRLSVSHRPATAAEVMHLQRSRRNDVTPVLLLAGHWLEFTGILFLLARWPSAAMAAVVALLTAVKCRHLQEISHFGIHLALCRSKRWGDALTEFVAQGPLGLATVADRRETHVRRHHPNANVPGADPNLDDLVRAGLYTGCSRREFLRATVFPLTPRGVAVTLRTIWYNISHGPSAWWRPVLMAVTLVATFLIAGPLGLTAVVAGRLLCYPQLAWMSLLVEHRWFSPTPRKGRPLLVEASRCVRILYTRPLSAMFARLTWLPYGDLFHFAHSVYPTIRWNYLPNVERIVGFPEFTPRQVWLGRSSVIDALRRTLRPAPKRAYAVDGPAAADGPQRGYAAAVVAPLERA